MAPQARQVAALHSSPYSQVLLQQLSVLCPQLEQCPALQVPLVLVPLLPQDCPDAMHTLLTQQPPALQLVVEEQQRPPMAPQDSHLAVAVLHTELAAVQTSPEQQA